MTPTLFGRWQTRLFLLATIGVLLSLPFAFGYLQYADLLTFNPFTLFGAIAYSNGGPFDPTFFWVLAYVVLFGLAWDGLYTFLQQFTWDRDWPGIVMLFGAIAEGALIVLLLKAIGLPFISSDLPVRWFAIHYGVVSFVAFLFSWGGMRILFPRARFRGGEWIGKWPSGDRL